MSQVRLTQIKNIEGFKAYVESRGLVPLTLCERPDDGYYAEIKREPLCWMPGHPKVEHFSQIYLSVAHWLHGKGPFKEGQKTEWVRLAFSDCSNKYILQA